MAAKKSFSTQKDLALDKLRKYCAYRDRSHAEARDRILKLKIYGDDLEEIIAQLISEGFLNEERYTRSFVRGKFRMNHWGRNKIIQALKAKKIPDNLISIALEEIDEQEYEKVLLDLLQKKASSIKDPNSYQRKQKLTRYAYGKGYEYEEIANCLKKLDL